MTDRFLGQPSCQIPSLDPVEVLTMETEWPLHSYLSPTFHCSWSEWEALQASPKKGAQSHYV